MNYRSNPKNFKLIIRLYFFQDYNPLQLQYSIDDKESGATFSHEEDRNDPKRVTGKYVVHLPDGRIQTVSYVADEKGYRATISYEGEAKYDDNYSRKPYRRG